MKGFLAFLLCLTVASGFVLKVEREDDELQWNAWKKFHGKSYTTESEEAARRAIWRDNLKVEYDCELIEKKTERRMIIKISKRKTVDLSANVTQYHSYYCYNSHERSLQS